MRPTDPDWADDGIVSLYISTFAARDDLYVANGAGVVREPLTPNVIREAASHNYPVSAYLGREDGGTHVGAIDFDRDDGEQLGTQVIALLEQHEIPSTMWRSRRGAHLWVTSVDWGVTVGTMHRMLKAALALACGQEVADDPKVEVFPKRGEGLAVGALRIPGLPHHKTQQVYPMWASTEGEWDDPSIRQVIEYHTLTTNTAIERLAGKAPQRASYPKAVGGFYGYKESRDWGPTPSASEVLMAMGAEGAKPGGTVKCPRHEDRRRSLTIFRDDERVYCGAPHCVLNGQGHGVGSVQLAKMQEAAA